MTVLPIPTLPTAHLRLLRRRVAVARKAPGAGSRPIWMNCGEI